MPAKIRLTRLVEDAIRLPSTLRNKIGFSLMGTCKYTL